MTYYIVNFIKAYMIKNHPEVADKDIEKIPKIYPRITKALNEHINDPTKIRTVPLLIGAINTIYNLRKEHGVRMEY